MTDSDPPISPESPPAADVGAEENPVVATSTPPPEPAPVGEDPFEVLSEAWGTGRRKAAVARVRLKPGSGKFLINKREVSNYFTEETDRKQILAALEVSDQVGKWDISVNVGSGGHTGQAGAIRLGIARALIKCDRRLEPAVRGAKLLTRDARRVERKKYGQRGARRRFQFSKR